MSSKVSNDIRPRKTVLLASPRGFCAGVDRAIQIVEKSIEKYGAPCLLYTSPSPRDATLSRMPSSA